MSLEATIWAWRQDVGNPIRKLILLHLADASAPENGWRSWYSLSKIAERCNCSRAAVSKHLAAMVEDGVIMLVSRGDQKSRKSAVYQLNVTPITIGETPAYCSPDEQGCSPDEQACSRGGREPVIRTSKKEPKERESAAQPLSAEKSKSKPSVNFDQLVLDAYHAGLPHWPKTNGHVWFGSSGQKLLHRIWKRDKRARESEFWGEFFAVVASEFEFWNTGRDGKPIEQARLSWLLTPSKYDAVITRWGELDVAS